MVQCSWCIEQGQVFRVKWDTEGQLCMEVHIEVIHGVKPRPGLCACAGGQRCCLKKRNIAGSCDHISCCISSGRTEAVADGPVTPLNPVLEVAKILREWRDTGCLLPIGELAPKIIAKIEPRWPAPGALIYGDPCPVCGKDGWPAGSQGAARRIHELDEHEGDPRIKARWWPPR